VSYHLRIDLPGAPRMNTADNRHWRVRQKEKLIWYELVKAAVWAEVGKPVCLPFECAVPSGVVWRTLHKARVRITRCTAANREPDFENLAQGGKHILDGLVRCGVLLDDNPEVIGQPEYKWEKAKRGEAHVVVEVWQSESTGEGE